MTVNNTTVEVVRGSVVDQDADAIVNAANTAMRGGGGVDGAIHRAAGPGLLLELVKAAPTGAKTGTVVVTGGHKLPHWFIFHTPGPVWHGGKSGEANNLASCYRGCMEAADARALESIAFCSISTGIYGYPLAQAAPLAVQTVTDYLTQHPDTTLRRVTFAMYQPAEFDAFTEALANGVTP